MTNTARSVIGRVAATAVSNVGRRARTHNRRLTVVIAAIAALVLLGIGYLTTHATMTAIKTSVESKLTAILETDIIAMKVWSDGQRRRVQEWAAEPHVVDDVAELVRLADAGGIDAVRASAALRRLRDTLPGFEEPDAAPRFAVVSEAGLLIGSHKDSNVGLRLSATGHAAIAGAFAGRTVLTAPHWVGSMVLDPPPGDQHVIILAAAPVTDDAGAVIAAFVFLVDRETGWDIMATARVGDTGETYAFDADGLMLSDSRFPDDLRAGNLLPDDAGESAVLQIQIRDPGGDITRGFRLDGPIAARPLTRMAASAIAGIDGVDTDGYRDYRGVEVVGAWRWLDDSGYGIATEIDLDEATRPLQPIHLVNAGMIVIVTLVAAGMIFASYLIRLLRSRIQHVQRLGQYALENKIGEGGMGTVYRARHAMLRRPTAVKLLRPDIVGDEAIERFEREVQLTSELTHPNTIAVYDYGRTADGLFYYAMEFLEGLTLADLIVMEDAMPPSRVVYLLKQICGSLAEAHGKGLVHRDVKPLNIFLCERGGQADVVKVLDFGLVKETAAAPDRNLTMESVVSGTPGYIAPESLRGERTTDPRVDVYAVGCVAFNLLTGEQVFTGSSTMEVVAKAVREEPPRPSAQTEQAIPPELDQWVVDCLSRDPARRPADAVEALTRLDAIDVPRWTQEDARQWWTGHQDAIAQTAHGASKAATVMAMSDATLAINLGNRGFGGGSGPS